MLNQCRIIIFDHLNDLVAAHLENPAVEIGIGLTTLCDAMVPAFDSDYFFVSHETRYLDDVRAF